MFFFERTASPARPADPVVPTAVQRAARAQAIDAFSASFFDFPAAYASSALHVTYRLGDTVLDCSGKEISDLTDFLAKVKRVLGPDIQNIETILLARNEIRPGTILNSFDGFINLQGVCFRYNRVGFSQTERMSIAQAIQQASLVPVRIEFEYPEYDISID